MLNKIDLELRVWKLYINWELCFAVNGPISILDITKEIKDYTDEKKQELIYFLKSL